MSRQSLNRKLKKATNGLLELERGEGYHYFVFDDGDKLFETESHQVYYFSHISEDNWFDWGMDFYRKMLAKHEKGTENG